MKNLRGIYLNKAEMEQTILGQKSVPFDASKAYVYLANASFENERTIDAMIGRCDAAQDFVDRFSALSKYSYFNDYQSGDSGAFTFDGRTFFRALTYYSDEATRAHVRLERLDPQSFSLPNTAFQLMPFGIAVLDDIYRKVVVPAFGDIGVTVKRADDFQDNDVISETILTQIIRSEFIIVEATEPNKNVFFELGYAASRGKEIITLLQEGNSLGFFDRSHIRYIEYSPKKPEHLKSTIQETVASIRSRYST